MTDIMQLPRWQRPDELQRKKAQKHLVYAAGGAGLAASGMGAARWGAGEVLRRPSVQPTSTVARVARRVRGRGVGRALGATTAAAGLLGAGSTLTWGASLGREIKRDEAKLRQQNLVKAYQWEPVDKAFGLGAVKSVGAKLWKPLRKIGTDAAAGYRGAAPSPGLNGVAARGVRVGQAAKTSWSGMSQPMKYGAVAAPAVAGGYGLSQLRKAWYENPGARSHAGSRGVADDKTYNQVVDRVIARDRRGNRKRLVRAATLGASAGTISAAASGGNLRQSAVRGLVGGAGGALIGGGIQAGQNALRPSMYRARASDPRVRTRFERNEVARMQMGLERSGRKVVVNQRKWGDVQPNVRKAARLSPEELMEMPEYRAAYAAQMGQGAADARLRGQRSRKRRRRLLMLGAAGAIGYGALRGGVLKADSSDWREHVSPGALQGYRYLKRGEREKKRMSNTIYGHAVAGGLTTAAAAAALPIHMYRSDKALRAAGETPPTLRSATRAWRAADGFKTWRGRGRYARKLGKVGLMSAAGYSMIPALPAAYTIHHARQIPAAHRNRQEAKRWGEKAGKIRARGEQRMAVGKADRELDELLRLERMSPYQSAMHYAGLKDGDGPYDSLRERNNRLTPAQQRRVKRRAMRTLGVRRDPFEKGLRQWRDRKRVEWRKKRAAADRRYVLETGDAPVGKAWYSDPLRWGAVRAAGKNVKHWGEVSAREQEAALKRLGDAGAYARHSRRLARKSGTAKSPTLRREMQVNEGRALLDADVGARHLDYARQAGQARDIARGELSSARRQAALRTGVAGGGLLTVGGGAAYGVHRRGVDKAFRPAGLRVKPLIMRGSPVRRGTFVRRPAGQMTYRRGSL